MKPELLALIEAYCSKASELIPQIAKYLDIKLPISNHSWASLSIVQRGKTNEGLQYFKHGFGVAIKYDGGTIDIDFGENGEYDGFDAWRLFRFAEENNRPLTYSNHAEIESELKDAASNGEVRFSGYILYYLNHTNQAGS